MTHTITEVRTLTTVTCYSCGVLFAMETELHDRLVHNPGREFWCPNGHSQHFLAKSWREQLKEKDEQIAWERRRAANLSEDLRSERAGHSVTKGQLTKAKKKVERIEKGVCPHCHRSFANVARHMETKHAAH